MHISHHRKVSIEYTLTSEDGSLLETSRQNEPLTYVQGTRSILPSLEAELEGKTEGDSVHLTLPPEKAYGLRDENLVQAVPRDRFQPGAEIREGMHVTATGPHGEIPMRVVVVGEEEITLDANHPLAGETLTFDVQVVDVSEATPGDLPTGTSQA